MISYSVASIMVSGRMLTEKQYTDRQIPVFTDLLRSILDDARSRLGEPLNASGEYKLGRAIMDLQPGWVLRVPDYSVSSVTCIQITRNV